MTELALPPFCEDMLRFDPVKEIKPGVPLPRANSADLPAWTALFALPKNHPQEQEAVLLRAAAQGVETPPEQLVRASMRME